MAKKITYTNRLIHEKSPYLLQHAHNPVDWYSWGNEAFQAAMSQDKPIFLSIGYATCHWCHAMEKESFEDPKIAELMNEAFVNIKVDREERPDIDAIYMDFAQSMLVGSAGWPLNLILTPSLKPFFAATYLPAYAQHGMMGLVDLIHKIKEVWHSDSREKVEFQSERIVEAFSQKNLSIGDKLPAPNQPLNAADMLYKIADPVYGGLKGAPKFPVGYQYRFLLMLAHLNKDPRSLFLVERTLDMMHRGGIYDHIGGGISRYSVDESWIIPHFEKMLYDNALIAETYIDAWKVTQKPFYKEIAIDILEYVLREMTHPEGGFYSAEDADSEGKEGWFYVWGYDEIEKIADPNFFNLVKDYFAITEEGNFEGKNVLHTPLRKEDFIKIRNLNAHSFEKQLQEFKKKAFQIRKKRPAPFKDDKILTSWNGLMIHTLAIAGAAFNEPRYTLAAKNSVNFIKTYLWNRSNLGRRYRDGETLAHGGLDDYSFFIRGLITLFEQGEGIEYLDFAVELSEKVEELFKMEGGAYFLSDDSDPSLVLRKSVFSDGAEPSGNAVHTENLLRLYQISYKVKYLTGTEEALKSVKKYLDSYSPGYLYHCLNISRFYDPNAATFYIALNDKQEHKYEIFNFINSKFLPHVSVVLLDPKNKNYKEIFSEWESYVPKNEKTTLYVCKRGRCQEPITNLQEMFKEIEKF